MVRLKFAVSCWKQKIGLGFNRNTFRGRRFWYPLRFSRVGASPSRSGRGCFRSPTRSNQPNQHPKPARGRGEPATLCFFPIRTVFLFRRAESIAPQSQRRLTARTRRARPHWRI